MSSTRVSLEDAIHLYYGEFRAMARRAMTLERSKHSLQPTELVHDLVRELQEQGRTSFNDRTHVFAYFRTAFRHILADHARTRKAQKRGGGWTRVSLSWLENLPSMDRPGPSFELYRALEKLESEYPRVAEVIVRRHFLGFSEVEIATQLRISDRTVRNDCRFATAWFRRELGVEPRLTHSGVITEPASSSARSHGSPQSRPARARAEKSAARRSTRK